MIEKLKQLAIRLKKDIHTLYLAARHTHTPWYAKFVVLIVMAYAFSPIDLIPDFIPVIGFLDELILLPLGIALAIWLIPDSVIKECRGREITPSKRTNTLGYFAALCVVFIWGTLAYWLIA